MGKRNDGRSLEEFVAFIEKELAPEGFTVEVGKRIYADGEQLAEFDVVITGKFGSTVMSWLIECRNRPSSGAAGPEWIQQAAGRRDQFNYQKVTVVSTTGFTSAAISSAKSLNVELREVAPVQQMNFRG